MTDAGAKTAAAPLQHIFPLEEQGKMGSSWFFTFVYCAFSFTLFYFAVTAAREPMFVLISGFFAVFGVISIVVTVMKALEYTRFGAARLVLQEPFPAVGGRLAGVLRLPNAAARPSKVKVELTCITVTTQKNEKGNDYTLEQPVWAGRREFPVRRGARGFTCAIDLPIADIPEIREAQDVPQLGPNVIVYRPSFRWELRVTTDIPGVDLDRRFAIAVTPPPPGPVPVPASAPASAPTPVAGLAEPGVAAVAARLATLAAALSPGEKGIAGERPSQTSGFVLIACNLVPLAGVLFWGWRVGDVVMLYWLENVVIGVMNVLRILRATPENLHKLQKKGVETREGELYTAKAMLAAFFLVHYGGFCLGHGTFLVTFFPVGERGAGLFDTVREVLREPGMLIAFTALVVSHAYSYFRNYIGTGEYLSVDVGRLMLRPYGRIVVVHIFIIAGGMLMFFTQAPAVAIALFVVLKIGVDFQMHRRERALLATNRTA